MADLEVVYDPQKELAAIVNIDERRGWGPSMIGPEAGVILQAFIDTTPFDVSSLADYDACQAFNSFLDRLAERGAAASAPDSDSTVVVDSDPGVADDAVHQTQHGAPTDEPPAPAPADTDPTVEADAGETHSVTDTPADITSQQAPTPPPPETQTCMLCDGTGTVQTSPDQPAAQCAMCRGSGKVAVAV